MEGTAAEEDQTARFSPANLRAAWWTLRASRQAKARLRRRGLDDLVELRPPPRLPPEAERGMNGVLRRQGESCLVRSVVRQTWYAAQGERRELIIGVTAPGEAFGAHAWLEGEPAHGPSTFHELLRRPSPPASLLSRGMGDQVAQARMLRAAAGAMLIVGAFLLLGTWDGLYERLDLPQGLPALSSQLGGAVFAAFAYVLWVSAAKPELAPPAATGGAIGLGAGTLIIAAWLIFRDPGADLGVGSTGTAILVAVGAIFGTLAVGLASVARNR